MDRTHKPSQGPIQAGNGAKYTRINSQEEKISYGFKPHNFPFKGFGVIWYKEENKNH